MKFSGNFSYKITKKDKKAVLFNSNHKASVDNKNSTNIKKGLKVAWLIVSLIFEVKLSMIKSQIILLRKYIFFYVV